MHPNISTGLGSSMIKVHLGNLGLLSLSIFDGEIAPIALTYLRLIATKVFQKAIKAFQIMQLFVGKEGSNEFPTVAIVKTVIAREGGTILLIIGLGCHLEVDCLIGFPFVNQVSMCTSSFSTKAVNSKDALIIKKESYYFIEKL